MTGPIIFLSSLLAMISCIINLYFMSKFGMGMLLYSIFPYVLLIMASLTVMRNSISSLFLLFASLFICLKGLIGDSQQVYLKYNDMYTPDAFDGLGHIMFATFQIMIAILVLLSARRKGN